MNNFPLDERGTNTEHCTGTGKWVGNSLLINIDTVPLTSIVTIVVCSRNLHRSLWTRIYELTGTVLEWCIMNLRELSTRWCERWNILLFSCYHRFMIIEFMISSELTATSVGLKVVHVQIRWACVGGQETLNLSYNFLRISQSSSLSWLSLPIKSD